MCPKRGKKYYLFALPRRVGLGKGGDRTMEREQKVAQQSILLMGKINNYEWGGHR